MDRQIAGSIHTAGAVQRAVAMTPQQLQRRTLDFSVAAYRFARPLLRMADTRDVARQLVRATTSVASNYRAARLARSHAEWVAKIGLVREEADETLFWLLFIGLAEIVPSGEPVLKALGTESEELTRIFAASYRTSAKSSGRRK